MKSIKIFLVSFLSIATSAIAVAPPFSATKAVNAFGIDLLRKTAPPQGNFLISPYSIQSAMAMAYAGAEGTTRDEMAKVLHFPKDVAEVNRSFAELRKALDDTAAKSVEQSKQQQKYGGKMDPFTLTIANRLFGQDGYSFRPEFLALMKTNYAAPFKPLDFKKNASGATKEINTWVEKQTQDRLHNLIPAGALDEYTRLVLVNAIYLKATWSNPFSANETQPQPFHIDGDKAQNVPTMSAQRNFGYAKQNGFSVVAVPYVGDLQFLILLPDAVDGLAQLETKLTPELLAECAQLKWSEVNLHLPKLKIPAHEMELSRALKSLGMKSAFDEPRGSANFNGIAPRKPDDYLAISDVFHMTFLSLDEKGTEAAAATAIVMTMRSGIALEPPKPIEVKVDHPFLFAIQHRPSGTALFIGRVSDPR